jgi:hypothetical protein
VGSAPVERFALRDGERMPLTIDPRAGEWSG